MTVLTNGFACDHERCSEFWRAPGIKRDATKVVRASDEARRAGWWFDRESGATTCPAHKETSLDYRRHHALHVAPDAADEGRLYRLNDVVRVRAVDRADTWAAFYRIERAKLVRTGLDYGPAPVEIMPDAAVLERLRQVSAHLGRLPFAQRIADDAQLEGASAS